MWPADTELGLLADGGLADVAGWSTAMTDGNDRRAMITARLTGATNKELEETYGRLEETGGCGRRMLGLLADRADGDDRRKGPTAMTDGGDRRAMVKARLTGVTNKELEETYGRLEETGGCSRRMLGLLAWRIGGCGWLGRWLQREGCGRSSLPKGAWRSRYYMPKRQMAPWAIPQAIL